MFAYFGHQGELGDGSIVAKDGSPDFGTGVILILISSSPSVLLLGIENS